jgi:hypothetical protein
VDISSVEKQNRTLQINLGFGAGANCWPAELMPEVPMKPRRGAVRLCAATGEDLEYHGRKNIGVKSANSKCGIAMCDM